MLHDIELMKAVANIIQRAERGDIDRPTQTFVDTGILMQLTNINDQILFGRRGTGKTHVLRVLGDQFKKDKGNAVIFIDGRTLGSTSQFSDQSVSIKQRCTSLFRDILLEIYNGLLTHLVYEPSENTDVALKSLEKFGEIAKEDVSTYKPTEIVDIEKGADFRSSSIVVGLSTSGGLMAGGKLGKSQETETEQITTRSVSSEDKVVFPSIHSSLNDVLGKADINLVILFDEWSSIPQDIQCYLAEFIKRGFLPNPRIVLKIASLEHRSEFCKREREQIIGFEVGSDISAGLDLDSYYVYDRNPKHIAGVLANILFRHIMYNLPDNYLTEHYGIETGERLPLKMFTELSTFRELVRASEGVVRDFLTIFVKAYFISTRQGRNKITMKSVLEAAQNWFEGDKRNNLDDKQQRALRSIVDEVIGNRHSRSFLVTVELENHPIIQSLFDARVLHILKKGYADKDHPGRRYNIYTLDFGTYVDLKGTASAPDFEILDIRGYEPKSLVPFDDKRSIRRIILTKERLNKLLKEGEQAGKR